MSLSNICVFHKTIKLQKRTFCLFVCFASHLVCPSDANFYPCLSPYTMWNNDYVVAVWGKMVTMGRFYIKLLKSRKRRKGNLAYLYFEKIGALRKCSLVFLFWGNKCYLQQEHAFQVGTICATMSMSFKTFAESIFRTQSMKWVCLKIYLPQSFLTLPPLDLWPWVLLQVSKLNLLGSTLRSF